MNTAEGKAEEDNRIKKFNSFSNAIEVMNEHLGERHKRHKRHKPGPRELFPGLESVLVL
jgi:hypothetical protein